MISFGHPPFFRHKHIKDFDLDLESIIKVTIGGLKISPRPKGQVQPGALQAWSRDEITYLGPWNGAV